jgi:hypothetical protein
VKGFFCEENPRSELDPIRRNQSSGWLEIQDEIGILGSFPQLMAHLRGKYGHVVINYNFFRERVDIECISLDESCWPQLLITFEPGDPDYGFSRPRGAIIPQD